METTNTNTIIQNSVWDKFGVSGETLINKKIDSIPCVIEPLFQKVGLACIAGSSDAGKSSFLRNLCMNIVAGKEDFLGFGINAVHKRAIYVSSEDDELAINYLINKQNKDMQIESSKLKDLVFVFDTENLLEKLERMMTERPIDIVCIDAFGDLYGGGMNDNNQVRRFLNEYSQLAQRHQCLVLFLHHCGKRTEDNAPSKNNLLGSQGFEAKMRIVMELRNDKVEAGMRHLCILKGNYLPQDAKNESYKLRFTENMVYENTGDRIPFENLKRSDDVDKERFEKAKELYETEKLSMEKIAMYLGLSNKSSISRLFKKFGYDTKQVD